MRDEPDAKLAAKAREIYDLLVEEYGIPERKSWDPMHELLLTILSANTNDVNSGRAFRTLMERYDGDYDAMRTAPLAEIKQAIRVAGMYNQKAPRLIKTLEMVKAERGEYNIDHVAEMPVAEGEAYLSRFPGVGHKTASIVLLFSFGKPAFPVDTHVQRLSQRLGISDPKASPAKIKGIWESGILGQDAKEYYILHINLIRHGRAVCQARNPQCASCRLLAICDYGQQVTSSD
jgi:endonuclease-3